METLFPLHVRDVIEHYSKLFQMSPCVVAIQLTSLTSFVVYKSRVDIKEINSSKIATFMLIGHSGGKKVVLHKNINENFVVLIKNKGCSRIFLNLI